jgi:hypothetical protein
MRPRSFPLVTARFIARPLVAIVLAATFACARAPDDGTAKDKAPESAADGRR